MKSKRSFWSDAEVTELLDLVKEKNILGKLDGKTKQNNLAYRGLAKSLKAKNMTLEVQSQEFVEVLRETDATFVQSMRGVLAEDRAETQRFMGEFFNSN